MTNMNIQITGKSIYYKNQLNMCIRKCRKIDEIRKQT